MDKYEKYLTHKGDLIVDLGCGIGNNVLYLLEKGILPIACDISEEAIKKIKDRFPKIQTKCFDMSEGLPFEKESIKVLIADLSLHYFDEETTYKLNNEIHSVLRKDGFLLCRLNSTNEVINKGLVTPSNENFLLENEGIYRRFFDQHEINRFFSEDKWIFIHQEEYELDRYAKKKMLWEIAMKPRYVD
ncbi:hypothetical protein D3C73_1034890 [compost metagenome]